MFDVHQLIIFSVLPVSQRLLLVLGELLDARIQWPMDRPEGLLSK